MGIWLCFAVTLTVLLQFLTAIQSTESGVCHADQSVLYLPFLLTSLHCTLCTLQCLYKYIFAACLCRLYDLYSFQVIPVLGEVIAGDWKSYQYLVESIRRFPPQVRQNFSACTNVQNYFPNNHRGSWLIGIQVVIIMKLLLFRRS